MDWLKKNYMLVAGIALIGGISLLAFSNQYALEPIRIQSIIEGDKVQTKEFYRLDPVQIGWSLTGTALINFALTLFVALFFVKYIEASERKKFETRLQQFQSETAEDAILSVFRRVIDDRFFNIVKENIFNAKTLRKNVIWNYDIYPITDCENGGLRLIRTITYEIQNLTSAPQFVDHSHTYGTNRHSTTLKPKSKIRRNKSGEYEEFSYEVTNVGLFSKLSGKFEIPAEGILEVVDIIEQEFRGDYIYETHFSKFPIVDLGIIVSFPENYEFSMGANFSAKSEERVNEERKKIITFTGGIFAGQGMEFICQPRGGSEPQPAQGLPVS